MKRLIQIVMAGIFPLAMASLAAAQARPPVAVGEPQPVTRLGGGYIEVANDLFMHILALADIRYSTTENQDFERRVRDRASSRNPESTAAQGTESDENWILLRFGAEFRYQKNLFMHMEFEERKLIDGNTMDDRANCTNPGGANVFGTAASDENPGFRIVNLYADYKFEGTPLRLRVGADIWHLDPTGLIGRHDPRAVVFGDFGAVDVLAGVVFKRAGTRLGYENDNDFLYYTFSAGFNARPHRFQFDVVYFRDRFSGARMQTDGLSTDGDKTGWTGQSTDSVLLMPSWTGRIGPVTALVQGNVVLGNARGGDQGIPVVAGNPLFKADRRYDIFAGGVVAYAEAEALQGQLRPFVGFFWGSADKDPSDRSLHGFAAYPATSSSQFTGVPTFAQFDISQAVGGRDRSCPARLQGLTNRSRTAATTLAANPLAIGTDVMGTTGGTDCWHDVVNPFNDRVGRFSHLGIVSTYSNVGTLMIPAGVKFFPSFLKGHEFTGWYAYRGIVSTRLIDLAFAPELAAQGKSHIGKGVYHEAGGYWLWTLNPYLDFRLSGTLGFAANASRDLAKLSDCNLNKPGVQSCKGDDVALHAEARIRARF